MINPISLVSGPWGYLAAAVIAAGLAGGGTYYLTSRGYQIEIGKLKLAQAQSQTISVAASLSQLQKFISTMHSAATDYNSSTQILLGRLDALQKEFHNATLAKPLPPDCRPDATRVRLLSEAVAAANATSAGHGFGETVRAASSPQ